MLRNIVTALALSFFAQSALGLGLGSLQKFSALNEPFSAQIEILGATGGDFDTLTVKLADTEQFERAGVLREAVLLGLKFKVVQARRGADYVSVTSNQPVKEPFLNFLIEMNWANGKMVREYTVLLDPPLYDPSRRSPAPAPVAAPRTAVAPPRSVTPSTEVSPTPSSTSMAPSVPSSYTSGGTIGPVAANDTLWALADAHRPADVSVQQMMMALFRANSEAFGNNNINFLKRGAILRVPSYEELVSNSRSEAVAEARRHHQLWNNYRQGAAEEVAERPMGDQTSAATTDDLMSDDDIAVDQAEEDARLELVAAEEQESSGVGSGGTGSASSLLQEQLDAKAQENIELRAKIGEADEIIDLMQRQVEIKDQELAALQARLAELGLEEPDVSVTPDEPMVEELPEVEPEVIEPEPETEVPEAEVEVVEVEVDTPAMGPVEPAVGLFDRFIPAHIRDMVPGGSLTILGVIGALLLLLFGGIIKWLMSSQRGERDMPARTSTAATHAPVAPAAEDTIDASNAAALETDTIEATAPAGSFEDTLEATADELTPEPEEPVVEEDPLEEVNVYLAYERFDQAEELVRRVVKENPGEPKYQLRLLEVFYSSNDLAAYEAEARNLSNAVSEDDPMWESALAMWSEMSPDRALFAEGGEALSGPADTGSMKAFVDITADDSDQPDTVSMKPTAESGLEATAIGLTNDDDEVGPVDFNLSEDDESIEYDGTQELDLTSVTDADLLGMTSTSNAQAEVPEDDFLDLTATSDGGQSDDDDIFDLTGTVDQEDLGGTAGGLNLEDEEPLDLSAPSDADENDLLDITKTGDMSGTLADSVEELMDVTSAGTAGVESTLGPDDTTVDFDISETVGGVFDEELESSIARAGNTSDLLDITGDNEAEDTIDFDIGGLDTTSEQSDEDLTLEFDGSSIPDPVIADDLEIDDTATEEEIQTQKMEAAGSDVDTIDFDLSLQSPTLDELSDTSDSTPDGDSAIDFDLALEDTSDMDSIVIDETLEMPKPSDEDESLEDLTKSMEESMAELELDMDSEGGDIDDDLDLALGDMDLDGDVERTVAIEAGSDISQDDDSLDVEETLVLPGDGEGDVDEIDTKLNLAKAYIELGDNDGARSILDEVMRDGSDSQQSEAQQLIAQLS